MKLDLDYLEQELADILSQKKDREEELNRAYNQEYFFSITDIIDALQTKEAVIKARIAFLTADTDLVEVEPDTYKDLLLLRLANIYNNILSIEQQQNMGHNEEHGLQMEQELESLVEEEMRLARELYDINSASSDTEINLSAVDVLSNLTRTLSIPSGDAGEFERECMQAASKMIELIARSLSMGQLTAEKAIVKRDAVQDTLKFFTANSVFAFKYQIKTAVLDASENAHEFTS